MFFFCFGTHIFEDKTSQLPLQLFKLNMNGQYLSSTGFKSIKVGLTMQGSSFKNRHFVAKELLKLNNKLNRLKIIFYYS